MVLPVSVTPCVLREVHHRACQMHEQLSEMSHWLPWAHTKATKTQRGQDWPVRTAGRGGRQPLVPAQSEKGPHTRFLPETGLEHDPTSVPRATPSLPTSVQRVTPPQQLIT